jgi:tripartite-type tricarboxylate transporter receptor subunit TctC
VPISYSQWSGIFVPAGTPPAVVNKLREAARMAAQDPKTVQVMTTAGTSFQFQDAAEFDKFVQDDANAMKSVVQKIGKVN